MNDSNQILSGIFVACIVFCFMYSAISIIFNILGATARIQTERNVHVVKTTKSNTFKTYSCIRTTKVK